MTSDSNADTDRIIKRKRKRYAQYGAPLYLLVDRQRKECTLFSDPHDLGYGEVHGPYSFGTAVALPAPFDLSLDTAGFRDPTSLLFMGLLAPVDARCAGG
ncbi:Uma2 family endonuclease [Nocardia xishanensis]